MSEPDIIGKVFNRLTVIKIMWMHKKEVYLVRCECGKEKEALAHNLRYGITKSCDRCKKVAREGRHGMTTSKTYAIWSSMLGRCRNKRDAGYHRYGGRGITVCDRWLDFKNFLEDMGEKPDGMSIDRKDNNKGYCKENCRWATQKEQCRNTRRNVMLTYNGETKCLAEWSEETGISRGILKRRINQGFDAEDVLTAPVFMGRFG